jgi:type I restriction enzyme M protein
VSNPPFSLRQWGRDRWLADAYGRNRFGLPPTSNGDYAWVMHMVTSMHPERGRVAVVLPHGALFRGGQEAAIRQKLLSEGLLDAVIGLGPNLFYGTGIPAAILVFRAGRADEERQQVLFVDASSFYTKGRAQNTLSVEQADQIYDLYRTRTDVPGQVRLVPMDEITANEGNLNIARYVQRQQEEDNISVPDALATLQEKLATQEQKEGRVAELLQREGLTL